MRILWRSSFGILPPPLNIEHPMYSVKREWRNMALREADFKINDLMVMWSRCVVGVDIVLDDEKKFSTTAWEDREETPISIREEPAKKASRKGNDPDFHYGRGYDDRNESRLHAALRASERFRAPTREPLKHKDPKPDQDSKHIDQERIRAPDIFLVVGWFPGKLQEPFETCVQVQDAKRFLPELHREIRAVRGWRSIFSFKTVQGFGLYKVRRNPRARGRTGSSGRLISTSSWAIAACWAGVVVTRGIGFDSIFDTRSASLSNCMMCARCSS